MPRRPRCYPLQRHPSVDSSHLALLETHDLHTAASGDVAFAHMMHPDSGTRRNGQDITVWVRSTVCLQRIDGRWLITHEHISFPINPENWSAVIDTTP